jgi:hypothetical protein
MGHRVIRGALIPSSYIIGSLKLYAKESVAPQNLTDRAAFGLGKFITEDLLANMTDGVGFGVTKFITEDLVNNLTESIVITNT